MQDKNDPENDTDTLPQHKKRSWKFKDNPDFLIEPDYFMTRWRSIPKTKRTRKHRVLLAMLFVTGARISELLLMRKMNVKRLEEEDTGLDYPILLLSIPTVKKRKGSPNRDVRALQHRRKCAIPMIGDYAPLAQNIWEYTQSLPSPFHFLFPTQIKAYKDMDGRPLPIERQQAWRIVKKYMGAGASCHLFRHSLATRMVERREWDAFDLKVWYNWSSEGLKMAGNYVMKNWKRIAKKTGYKF